MNNRKEQIIQSICSMDIESLNVLLDESEIYINTRKSTFIEKLRDTFLVMNVDAVETENKLVAYKGYCANNECPNCGMEGVSFTSKNGGVRFDLIISDVDGKIAIYQCHDIITYEVVTQNTFKYEIQLYEHEKIGFVPTNEFSTIESNCQDQLDQLNLFEDRIEDLEFIKIWINKNNSLYDSLYKEINHPVFEFFQDVYSTLNDLIIYSQQGEIAHQAVTEFSKFSQDDVQIQLEWLKQYINIAIGLFPEIVIEDHYFKMFSLKIESKELRNLVEFKSIFDHLYSVLGDEFYQAYPDTHRIDISNCGF
jgi:hypothetical protein